MACVRPLKAYRAHGGQIVFSSKEGFSDRPLELPCGQCIECRLARSRTWAVRCVHEAMCHEKNSFVTMTYSPEFYPKDGSLHHEDCQKFLKRLRKKIGKFRYFLCGEYGDKSLRPHYHMCLFGYDFSDDRFLWKKQKGNRLYKSLLLETTWAKGYCVVGDMTYESAAYVARYVVKKRTGEQAEMEYSRVDKETGEVFNVRPPYVVMSRRPGIGAGWFEKFSGDVYPADEVIHEGRRFRPPRFYDDKCDPELLENLKGRRRQKVAARSHELTPERLKEREKCAELKVDRQSRRI